MSVVSDSVRPHRWQPTRLPSLGFSRQQYWSGLPFSSPVHESDVAQSNLTLCDPMDCSLPGSSVHGISQARVLEWVAIAFSKGNCQWAVFYQTAYLKVWRNRNGVMFHWTECTSMYIWENIKIEKQIYFKLWRAFYYFGVRSSRLWFFQWSCMDVRVGLWRKLSTEELMLLNCGVGEDSWESLGLQGDPTSPL